MVAEDCCELPENVTNYKANMVVRELPENVNLKKRDSVKGN